MAESVPNEPQPEASETAPPEERLAEVVAEPDPLVVEPPAVQKIEITLSEASLRLLREEKVKILAEEKR